MADTAGIDNGNQDMLELIGRSWGWVLFFGIATLILGILVILQPKATIYGFALLLGIWLFVSGLFRIIMAIADNRDWGAPGGWWPSSACCRCSSASSSCGTPTRRWPR